MTTGIKIGIRQLVEFCCRRGDLRYSGNPRPSAQDGLRTHQKIQQRYKHEAVAEFRVSHEVDIGDYQLQLGGRIDLLFENETPPRLEEIKTVYSFMSSTPESYEESHWAQLKCYAACYLQQKQLETVAISLNYVNLFNHQEYRENKTCTRIELKTFLDELLRQYLEWYRLVEKQRDETIASCQTLEFPHSQFRPQQHQFAAQVYRNIQRQGQLMVEAPTGSGKTISTLFPSVKAIGEQLIDQIIYLSAKTSGQNQAVAAIEKMATRGLAISYLVIQAKAKSCACHHDENEIGDDGQCSRILGFFDRLPQARAALLRRRHLNPKTIREVANEYRLCPFELSLQLLPWIDIVIADLNYVFDPVTQLNYFKADSKRKLLLIDELHNLVDRARGMYSAQLSRAQINQALSSSHNPQITRITNTLKRALDKHSLEQNEDELVSDESPLNLVRASQRFSEKLALQLLQDQRINAESMELGKAVFRLQTVHQLFGGHHKTIDHKPVDQRRTKLLCLNAFEYLSDIYPLFTAVCGFSATLSPKNYFHQALGFDPQAQVLRLASSFPAHQLQVNICSYIDTRYRQRESYIDQICATSFRCYQKRPGNYILFFSSYYFMQRVHQRFQQLYDSLNTLVQEQQSSDEQRQAFLDQFQSQNNTLGFAIMGGVFAEGIDYHGNSLIGAIIIGVGLPQSSTEQQLIESDFKKAGLNGFDYAYRYPGLIRVQQSAGRVIRSETDRGVIILLDRRFQQPGYRNNFPPHWQARPCPDIETLDSCLTSFWDCEPPQIE